MIPYVTALEAFKEESARLGKPWIDAPEQDECLTSLIRWAIRSEEYGGRLTAGILLRGHRDSGKTHAVRCLVGMLRTLHGSTYAPFTIKICQELVSAYNQDGEQAINDAARGQFLMYDDLGEERDGNFMGKACNVMSEVIQNRYRTMQDRPLVTMFTTNLPNDKAIAERYGQRVATRIDEMCDVILWKGPKEGFRKQVKPLPWMWPESPQAKEASRIEGERRAAEYRAWAEKQKAEDEKRKAEEVEAARIKREKELSDAMVGIDKIGMEVLLMSMRMHPEPDMKALYRAEIERRTKANIQDVETFLNTPDPEYKPAGTVVLQLHPEAPLPSEEDQPETDQTATA